MLSFSPIIQLWNKKNAFHRIVSLQLRSPHDLFVDLHQDSRNKGFYQSLQTHLVLLNLHFDEVNNGYCQAKWYPFQTTKSENSKGKHCPIKTIKVSACREGPICGVVHPIELRIKIS